jgi:hypothetical protein
MTQYAIKTRKTLFHEILWFIFICITYLAIDKFYAIDRFFQIGARVQGEFNINEYIRHAVFLVEYALAVFIIYASTNLNKNIHIFSWYVFGFLW